MQRACIADRGPNYFEVDIDVGSSKSAASVVGLVQGALKGLVIDMAITMEGHTKVTNRSMQLHVLGVCCSNSRGYCMMYRLSCLRLKHAMTLPY